MCSVPHRPLGSEVMSLLVGEVESISIESRAAESMSAELDHLLDIQSIPAELHRSFMISYNLHDIEVDN